MPRFDRYMLSQFLTVFGFFSLVLVLMYWINQAVQLFDQIITDGQSAWVFLELTALSLPALIQIVLPLAAFASAVYVTNRMASESELVVVQATGYSAFRLARPVVVFGGIVTALMLVLTHVLVPLSQGRLIERQAEISRNLSARLLTQGQFMSPSAGVTLFVRDVSAQGELRDVFLSDSRRADRHIGYTASRAFLVRAEAGPQLVMIDGLAQTLVHEDQRLFTTSFDDFAYDVSALVPEVGDRSRSARELTTAELLSPTPALEEETGRSAAYLVHEGHDRFVQPLTALVGALLGFAALLVGGFSRFGLWQQILGAVVLVVVMKSVESAGMGAARAALGAWPAAYAGLAFGLAAGLALLVASARPYLLRRRPTLPEGGAA
ncbi:LPS export ABC transporter permease LptF [Salibaculum sp.]|uniref:LPS export ABC transporter permease LptF n=1 Tax=Salibaculum sp. TaxID=2855480 RepID=UPI002B466F8A|nr:LPS export ABC transporter permease LptF [Salibaculum sp.]HKL69755.1 LPS export ABC transporter permease LptF [Salibaculum sp.]